MPSLADQHVGRKPFELPVLDVVAILHVNVEVNVRILPVNLGDDAGDGDRFRLVVFGPKRMMRQRGDGRNNAGGKDDQEVNSHVPKTPAEHYIASENTRSALVWYSFFLSASLMGKWSVTFTSSGTNW